MPSPRGPIRIAVLNDYEVVVRGVATLIAPYADRVSVVELDSQLPPVSAVDVVLYDTFGQVQADAIDLASLAPHGDARVVVFSWNVDAELVQRAMARGAAGYLSKEMSAEQIVTGIEMVHRGRRVVPSRLPGPSGALLADSPVVPPRWPGQEVGLSAREAEVLALITQGLSNQDIAEHSYLSINSVKTYIRTAYRKIGVERRAQAVAWGMAHGFTPDRQRILPDTEGP